MDLTRETNGSAVRRLRAKLAELGRVPREQARALSAGFYTSREYNDFERETLFRTEWICLGHAGSIPAIGDYFTTELVGEQLLVVRESPASRRGSCADITAGLTRSMAGSSPRR
jgi:hypothetical protein